MTEHGYVDETYLPDGRLVAVMVLTFGRGRVLIGDDLSVFKGW